MKREKLPTFHKFGKLLKYDFLESLYPILLINGILLLLMAMQKFIIDSDSDSLITILFWLVAPMGYILSLVFLTITIIRLLYNRIFTPDGYLTFALPVSLDAILISKIFVSGIYVILSAFVLLMWGIIISDIMNIADFAFIRMDGNLLFVAMWGFSGVVGVFSMSALVLLILAILHIGAITRFRTLCGIALFMFFMMIESLCYGIIFGDIESLKMLLFIGVGFNAMKGICYYFAARYLIANKLEI